ncbi:hypothetical protein ACFQZZ_01075 [Nocardia sp. GCM10030253]
MSGNDHHSHGEQGAAIGDYIRWHDHHTGPVRNFAVGSKIRHLDYPPKAA